MSVSLPCGQCGYANEPERVYCHNCGGKLDRALLPTAEEDKKRETPDRARKRIKRMTNPPSGSFVREVKAFFMTLLWAALVAALALIARKPDGVPEGKDLVSRPVQSDLMEALESPTPRTLSFTEAEINQALKQTLRSKETAATLGIKFERAYVSFFPGVARVGNLQSLWGYPLYSTEDYRLAVREGKFTPTLVGGSFGRLQVHPQVMQYIDFSFKKLWSAMQREAAHMQKMQSVTITQGQITFVTRGAAAR